MRGNARAISLLAIDGWLLWTARPDWSTLGNCVSGAARAEAGYGADHYICVLAGAAAWLTGWWLAIGLVTTLLGALPGRSGSMARAIATTVMPRAVRTVLVAVTTTSVSLSAATGTATASGRTGTPTRPAQLVATSPAWPSRPSTPADARITGSAAAREHTVVQPGDSLWLIASRHLHPGASETEIAATWPRWFAANREVVGNDPNLLHPGTQLVNPEATAG